MNRILVFDDRGKLYFSSKEDLVYIRNTVVCAMKKLTSVTVDVDAELLVYSLDDDNKPYKWSSLKEKPEEEDWLENKGKLIDGGELIICDYSWNSASEKYKNALEDILSEIIESNKEVMYLLYSTVLQIEAQDFLDERRKNGFPDNIKVATEVIAFGEEVELMAEALKSEIKYIFEE